MSDDHERLLEIMGALESAITVNDAGAATALVNELHDALHVHARREELGVFTQLRREVRDEHYVAAFVNDHEVLHGLLRNCSGDAWKHEVAELVSFLREHILREETDLFPAAHQMLGPTHWTAVDEAVRAIVHA